MIMYEVEKFKLWFLNSKAEHAFFASILFEMHKFNRFLFMCA